MEGRGKFGSVTSMKYMMPLVENVIGYGTDEAMKHEARYIVVTSSLACKDCYAIQRLQYHTNMNYGPITIACWIRRVSFICIVDSTALVSPVQATTCIPQYKSRGIIC